MSYFIDPNAVEDQMEQCLNEIFSKDTISFKELEDSWEKTLKDKAGEWYEEGEIIQSNGDTRLLDIAEMSDDMEFFEDAYDLDRQLSIPPKFRKPLSELGGVENILSGFDSDGEEDLPTMYCRFKIDQVGTGYTTASCKYGKIYLKNSFLKLLKPQVFWCPKKQRWITEKEVMEEVKYPYFGKIKFMGPHCQLPWRLL